MEMQETIEWVAAVAVRELAEAEFAVVVLSSTVRHFPGPGAVAASSEVALKLFEVERVAADGPCLSSLHSGTVNCVEQTTGPGANWQMFRAACARRGVLSALFVPLEASGVLVGVLGLYSQSAHSSSTTQLDVAEEFAVAAAVVLKNASDYWAARAHGEGLAGALESRAVIEQAKGILMHTLACGPERAFTLLSEQSQFENRKVREIAAEIVALTSGSGLSGRNRQVVQGVRARMTRCGDQSTGRMGADSATLLVDVDVGLFAARSLVDHGRRVVQVEGELDASASGPLMNVVRSNAGASEVDMSALTFMDCAGYRALIAAWSELPETADFLQVRHACAQPRRLLQLLDHLQLAHPGIIVS